MKQTGKREQNPQGVQHRETTRDERMQVITLRDHASWSWARIGQELNIDRRICQKVSVVSNPNQCWKSSSIIKIYQRSQESGTPSNSRWSGRRPIFIQEEKARLEVFITRDSRTRRLSWDEVCLEMGYACCPRTVKAVMEGLGYHRRVPRRRFVIRPANKPLRVAWCQARLNWTYEDWMRVLWTDESTFSTVGFGNRPWVTRKASEEYHANCVDATFESGRQSRMVWGGFCGTMRSKLVLIPSKAKVDSSLYVTHIMHPNLVPFWHRCCEEYGWVTVVEDEAPGHKGFSTRYRDLNQMETTCWPAQSPDLNLIENL